MSLPKIIYGTAWKKEMTTPLVIAAILRGFRAVDTACQPKHYSESLVGEALQALYDKHSIRREDLFLQTKYTPIGGQDATKPLPYNPEDYVTAQVKASFEKSLANLRTTYLDSYVLHSPLPTIEESLEAWRVLASLQDSGKVKMIGLSNVYDVSVLETLAQERKVQVVQNRWYQRNGWDREVLDYCRKNGIMYQSFWTLTGSPNLLVHPSILSVSKILHCTPEQALFKYAQSQGITPLSGTSSEYHMEQDVAVEKLDAQDAHELEIAMNEVNKVIYR